jgi:FdhD protein
VPPERSLEWTRVTVWDDGTTTAHLDSIAAEEPLEISIADRVHGDRPLAVTMRTPGHDHELAAGFLLTEGILKKPDHLLSLQTASVEGNISARAAKNRICATLRDSGASTLERVQRNFFASSSCGICGKATIDAVRLRGLRVDAVGVEVHSELICELPGKLSAAQAIFAHTGGLHAAALFDLAGELLVLREDIGRHNAVDKVVGWAMQRGLVPLHESILLVSGRCGFEITQKAIVAGIPVVASISAPSTLAVQLARELGLTLIGFLRERRFVIYSGAQRCRL